jgi:MFS transporter, SP family, solute carrier family 2 (myo-inositol transporter), member 13
VSTGPPTLRRCIWHRSCPRSMSSIVQTIVSATIWAAALGAVAGGRVADVAGRRNTLAAADIVFIVGALCMAAAQSVDMLIVGRVLVGLGVGIASIAVPVYIAEVSHARVRARAVVGNVLAITGVALCCRPQLRGMWARSV